jgi:hypothetical protein
MTTYVYYYKSDVSREIIGRINANNLLEAHGMIMEIKRLPAEVVSSMFEIKQVRDYEFNI